MKEHPFGADLAKYYRIHLGTETPKVSKKMRIWLFHLGLHCVMVYRFGQYARELYAKNRLLGFPVYGLSKVFLFLVRAKHHVQFDVNGIGPGFYIAHVGSIYLGSLKIGSNFTVAHNVTLGAGHSVGKEGVPKIGDNVWIGTGSTISGDVSIGDNVTISNGSMLSRSVPDGCLVAGNPARVISREYDNSALNSC